MALTNQKKAIYAACLIVLLGGVAIAERGCGSGSPYTAAQQTTLDRMHDIVASSGGDWEKVKPEDKKFFISGPGSGSENSAKITFGALAAQQKSSK